MAIERRGTGRTLGLMLRAMSEAIIYGHAMFIDHDGTPRTETALRDSKRKLEDLCDELALNIKVKANVADWCLDLHATPYMHGKPLEPVKKRVGCEPKPERCITRDHDCKGGVL